MNAAKRVITLSTIVGAITIFWLMPGINTAKETTYVRRYEDTDRTVTIGADSVRPDKKAKPKYKTEKLSSKRRLSKVSPEMFSRAIQFEEEIVSTDSVQTAGEAPSKVIQFDTVAVAKTDDHVSKKQ